tara:strand:- start:1731 stop:2528 length:798 start_codon:yes stop_codon:yes gene_type:complete
MIIETKEGTWPCIYHGNGDSKNSNLFKKIVRLDTKEMYKEQNPKDADLTILTWSVKGETTMLEDCFERKGIKDSLYVMNIDKPFNWLDKIKTIQEYLPYVKTKYVMALDSTDIIVSTDSDGKGRIWSNIIDVLETMGCKMLWNAEKRSWPSIGVGSDSSFNKQIRDIEDFEDKIYRNICESEYCRLNSGAFIGLTDYVKEFYHTTWHEYTKEFYQQGENENMFGGDQGFIRNVQRQAFPETVIDYDCRIFHTFVDVKEKEITIHE